MSVIVNAYADGHISNVYEPSGITAKDVRLIATNSGIHAHVDIPSENLSIDLRGEGEFSIPPNATTFSEVTGVMYKGYTYFNDVLVTIDTYTKGADPVKAAFDFEYIKSLLVGDDRFYASSAVAKQDEVMGLSGNDIYQGYGDGTSGGGSSGRDRFFGGDGTDTAIYRGALGQYNIKSIDYMWDSRVDDGSRISGIEVFDLVSDRDGTDELNEVERLQFSDINLALDTGKGEIAGSAYRLYKAAFDRAAEADGLGFWINTLDNGANLVDVAQGFINSAEFTAMYGANPTDQQFVTLLYNHVLHRPPEGEGYQFWLNSLSVGVSRAEVLKDFSESTENITQTAEIIANGIQYEVWTG